MLLTGLVQCSHELLYKVDVCRSLYIIEITNVKCFQQQKLDIPQHCIMNTIC